MPSYPAPHPGQVPTYAPRRATRDTSDIYIGGVASGIAKHLGWPVLPVRIGFVALATLGGLGVALYAGLWLMLPGSDRFSDEAPGIASASRGGRRPGVTRRLSDIGPMVALAALALGAILLFEGAFGRGALFWPTLLALGGVALFWRQADEAQRDRWRDTSQRIDPLGSFFGDGSWAAYARIGAGLALIVAAFAVFGLRVDTAGPPDLVIAGTLGVVGLAIAVGPWVVRLTSDLAAERTERVRSQERADVAAHLHDSVLQTLALIQKNSSDPATVSRLARSQERDLRSWLFSDERVGGETVAAALRGVAADVESEHDVKVEVVAVGDAPLDEAIEPAIRAAREAVVNAAKHAGTGHVDVYAETMPSLVEIFVKDRGVGFDPEQVADDRHGVRGSIIDRMARHGGAAEIRSSHGVGTEVVLRMPRPDEEKS